MLVGTGSPAEWIGRQRTSQNVGYDKLTWTSCPGSGTRTLLAGVPAVAIVACTTKDY